MSDVVVARRYAQALFNLANKQNQTDTIEESLRDLGDAIQKNDALLRVALDPKVPPSQKEALVANLSDKMGLVPILKNFLRLLAQKRRLELLGDVADIFSERNDVLKGRAKVDVVSAIALSDTQQKTLQAALTKLLGGKTTALSLSVDTQLLGGLVVTAGSLVWDASIGGKLRRLRQTMLA